MNDMFSGERVYTYFDLMICGPNVLQKVYNAISVVFLPKMLNQILQTPLGKYELQDILQDNWTALKMAMS